MRRLDKTSTPLNAGATYTTAKGVLGDDDALFLKGHALADQAFRVDVLQSSDGVNDDVADSFYSVNDGTNEVCKFATERFAPLAKFSITNTSAANMTVLRASIHCV